VGYVGDRMILKWVM